MKRFTPAPLLGASVIALCSLLAACGGGGGGGGSTPPVNSGGGNGGNGGGPTPGSTATPTPGSTATPTPGATGTMAINGTGLANATVAFTCGCNGQAGKVTAGASGNYTINVPATAFNGSGTYTPAGHNLMVIGYAGGSHAQAWTMEFFGTTPSHNLNLSGNSSGNTSDEFTTAAALYVYYETAQYYSAHPSSDNTYDIWNFNNIASFEQSMKASGGNNASEVKLIADIKTAQSAGTSMYPVLPQWDPNGSVSGAGSTPNSTIVNDIRSVAGSGDTNLPQICGTSCSGAPTP